LKVVRFLEEPIWRQFVDGHPAGNVFHTPEMYQVFTRTKNHRPTLWAVVDDDGRVLVLLLAIQIVLLNCLRCLTTRAVAYGSVLCAPGPEGQEALTLLLRTYVRQVDGTPLFTELRNLSDLGDVQPILREHGFGYEGHLNYLIDLNCAPEAILQNIGPRTRKHIRRELRRGEILFEEATDRERVAVCYELLCRTYRRAGVPLADRSLFEAAFDLLYPKGMARFTLVRLGQTPVAVSVELLYKDVMYGWYGGIDRAHRSHMPNELLMWHILQWGSENGYRLYDFGGAGRTDEEYGVRDFKAKFGGTLVCYGRNTYVHRPLLLRLSQWGFEAYRRFL